jgi:pectinesterase
MMKNDPSPWTRVSVFLLIGGSGLAQTPTPADKTLVVAGNGSGQYRTVQAAVDAIPINGTDPVTIRIKPGTYTERIEVPRNKPHVRFVGEDAAKTILTYELNALSRGPTGRAVGTSGSTSTNVLADDFTAENITFAKSTPRDVAQALARSANGDLRVYRRCRFLGWQDTLYAIRSL